MSRTKRNPDRTLFGGINFDGFDGKSCTRSRGYRWYKKLMRKVRRRRDRQSVIIKNDYVSWPKSDKWWW